MFTRPCYGRERAMGISFRELPFNGLGEGVIQYSGVSNDMGSQYTARWPKRDYPSPAVFKFGYDE
jgi:hypothetical protein